MSTKRSSKPRQQTEKKTPQNFSQLQQPRPFAPLISPKSEVSHSINPTGIQSDFQFGQINVLEQDSRPHSPNLASPLQAKLTIGQPGDKYEQEADQVAAQAVQQINNPQAQREEDIQRQVSPEEEEEIKRAPAPEEEEEIQRTPISPIMKMPIQRQSSIPVGPASDDFEKTLSQARSGGRSLETSVQTKMESAIGADFSGVRIHTGTQADQLSRSIQAKAFTTGKDVFFKQGEYNPNSRSGQELLAHELTHTVQQGGATAKRQVDSAHTTSCRCSNCTGQRIQRTIRTSVQRETDARQSPHISTGMAEPASLQRAVHENSATTKVRLGLGGEFTDSDEGLSYLASKVNDVLEVPNTLNFTSSWDTFKLEYAKYLSIAEVGDESQANAKLVEADTNLKAAQCRGFTNQKSQTWYYSQDPVEASDVVHEMVHILSAKGGGTQLMAELGTFINEGVTHMFTKKLCGNMGITVAEAYPAETAFAEQLATAHGISLLYKAYFKGNVDGLLTAMAQKYEGYVNGGQLGNGKNPSWGDKNKSLQERKDIIKSKMGGNTSNNVTNGWLAARVV
ncbi:MAG: DUF4157 domain-containing protein [Cyanobacteria bacterium J06635_1]